MLCWLYALPPGLEEIIRKSGIPKNDISIYIKEAGSNGREVASLNAARTRTPASVIKVLTTYAAVLKLGFDYRWPTQFYTAGSLKNGVLHGDLLVKGFGDPTLSDEDLPDIVAEIKAKGIGKISGNIVIDRSYFNVGTKNNSGFDKHTYSPYNAMPDAMMFNERVSTICVVPNKNDVHKKVPDGSYVITNHLQRVNKPCRGRYSWPAVKIDESKAVPEVLLKGKISKRCGNRNICKVITKPYKSFYYALKEALAKEGVEVSGTMKLRKIPHHARILFTHYSKPLEKVIAKTAKKSNNLYARHLLLFLGAKLYGAPATLAKGRKAVKQILRSHGALGSGTLHIDNGSGLSRTAKLNAKMLAKMYDNAYDRYRTRWMETLSIAGVDGTIKRRFRGTVARKRAWMKTGTLKRVKNIGGYVKSRSGRFYTVVILVNTRQGRWKAAKLQNDMIIWLVKYKGRGIKPAAEKKRVVPVPAKPEERIKKETPSHQKASLPKRAQKYFIQAGSFSHMPDESYLKHIEKLGMQYTVRHERQYKVLVGGYADEEHARKALKKIRRFISNGAFLVKDEHPAAERTVILY
jgi:D-alanyl-D-alanine carboxypeptidase/D-alanyl-D-alanine-endopeptidase (penicillin-binding protein 4)